jgi:hypothetical protein
MIADPEPLDLIELEGEIDFDGLLTDRAEIEAKLAEQIAELEAVELTDLAAGFTDLGKAAAIVAALAE